MSTEQQPSPPSTAEGAQARLSELASDPSFRERLLSGDVDTRGDFQSLTQLAAGLEKLPGAEELSKIATKENDNRNTANFISGVNELIEVRPEVLRQAIFDVTVPEADYKVSEQFLKRALADEAWGKRLLAGDPAARRELFLAAVSLSKEIAK